MTWAQRLDRDDNPVTKRSMRGGDAARWDRADRNVLRGLETFGFSDAYRSTMGWEARECSWIARRNGSEFPRSFDHAFTSDAVEVEGVRYLHGAREEGLSDHSALELEFGVCVNGATGLCANPHCQAS